MKNPFKIIHKFKNNNNRIQYLTYIFVGSLVDDDVLKILESITEKDFFDAITQLNQKVEKLPLNP